MLLKGRKVISKSGKIQYCYYQRKYPNGRKSIEKQCREHDGNVCQACGQKRTLTRKLDVCRRDGERRNKNDELADLITLCHRCNMQRHFSIPEKYEDIISRRKSGETFQGIANDFKLSRQRIQKIYSTYAKRA